MRRGFRGRGRGGYDQGPRQPRRISQIDITIGKEISIQNYK
jgi:hypothetical protein